ncbi:MAG TPA: S8 family serine peptidase [Clostridia bacterium]
MDEFLQDKQRLEIKRIVDDIIFESKILPLIGVITDDASCIKKLPNVKNVRESTEGMFQEGEFNSSIIFQPPARRNLLVGKQLVGWGSTRIFVLDSGVNQNEVNVAECKDFSHTGISDAINHGNVVAKIVKYFAKGSQLYVGKIGNKKPDELVLIQAIEWAASKGANIINISAGFARDRVGVDCKDGDCDICTLVNTIASKGIAVVVAAGNRSMQINSIDCPGNAMNSITVGAVDKDMDIAGYSSIGSPGQNKPNLVAPGDGYLNLVPFSGTSFSAPYVSGVLGAILNKVGNIEESIEYIYKTCIDLNKPFHYQGVGCISLERLVEAISNEDLNIESKGQNESS